MSKKNNLLSFGSEFDTMYFFIWTQASDGWTYYFKKKHNIVDRHIDKIFATKPPEDEAKLKSTIEKFKTEKIPEIMAYDIKKVL